MGFSFEIVHEGYQKQNEDEQMDLHFNLQASECFLRDPKNDEVAGSPAHAGTDKCWMRRCIMISCRAFPFHSEDSRLRTQE